VLDIIQNHYPERLGLAVIMNVPFILKAFFTIISPFIDPLTRTKMRFNPSPIKDGIFTTDQLMKEWWKGDREFVYEHDKYWPDIVRITQERKQQWLACWREQGGTIGLKEWDYKRAAEARARA
jgi:hypothetical protein